MSVTPTFTIVVPTFQRPEHLSRCLRALGTLDYPADAYEVVIVDDADAPATREQTAATAQGMACRVRYLSQHRMGPARARNLGAKAAHGRYLAFTDDDCAPEPGWLVALERAVGGTGRPALAGGTTVNALAQLPCAVASQTLIDFLYDYHAEARTPAQFFTSNNFAVSTSEFRDIGGFDEAFPLAAGEDREFCERWQRHGGLLVQATGAVVTHWHHLNFRRFMRQHFNYGRGAHFLHESRLTAPGMIRTALPRREPLTFYMRMLRYPFSTQPPARAMVTATLLALSQVTYVTGYFAQRRRKSASAVRS